VDWLADLLVDPAGGRAPGGGVRRFVPDDGYAQSFGRQWNWFARTQLDRPEEGRIESEQSFFKKTGWSSSDLDGKTVLDAGCGMGRFTDVAARHGARVVGADLSRAVDAAHENLADRESVALLQADILDLPLRPGSFDLIFSIGVLHHTPDTRAAFEALVPLLKPGGRIAIWIYSGEPRDRVFSLFSDQYRRITRRMDRERLLRICRRVAPRLGRFYRTRYGHYLMPLLPVSNHPDPEWRVLDTFDWYSPRYQWKHRWSEVEAWFADAGLVRIQRGTVPVSMSGALPD
jgi:SAM-dependent methyltransferase